MDTNTMAMKPERPPMTEQPSGIEAAARALCAFAGENPDFVVPYEQSTASGLRMLREQPKDNPNRWPEMPLWQWKYAKRAQVCIEAAAAASDDLRERIARIKADPGDGTLSPDIGHVLARGFEAMGWERPQSAAEDIMDAILAARPGRDEDFGKTYSVEYDGFVGTMQGSYITREGREGVVLQQVGTKVVHVYGRNRIKIGSGSAKP
jgi:hypothetical protein